jgi:hypothetical protein
VLTSLGTASIAIDTLAIAERSRNPDALMRLEEGP